MFLKRFEMYEEKSMASGSSTLDIYALDEGKPYTDPGKCGEEMVAEREDLGLAELDDRYL